VSYGAFALAVEEYGFRNPRQIIRLHNTLRLLMQMSLSPSGELRRDAERMRAMLFWLEYLNERPSALRESLDEARISGDVDSLEGQDRAAVESIRRTFGASDAGPPDFKTSHDFVQHFVLPGSVGAPRLERRKDDGQRCSDTQKPSAG